MPLHVQISDLDHYHHALMPLDQLQSAPKVPVLRVYGSVRVPASPNLAYTVLVHVHNFYPYLYIDCLETDGAKLTDSYLERIKAHLELAIAESFRRKQADDDDSDADDDTDLSSSRFIAAVAFCRGTPVYGYHLGYSVVLKVLFLLPLYKTRLFHLLGQGQVDFSAFAAPHKKHLQPEMYEGHINYPSQFLADFNLYGCAWLELASCHFRLPVVNVTNRLLTPLKEYLSNYIAHNNVLSPKQYPRMGRTLLEIDVHIGDIVNRSRLVQRHVHGDLAEFNGQVPKSEIFLSSLKYTFEDLKYQCVSRDRPDTSQLLTELYSQIFSRIGLGGYCDWETLGHYEKLLEYAAKLNKGTGIGDANQYFEKYIRLNLVGSSFPTSFEIVDLTMPLSYYCKVPLLNFRDDLVRWKNYEDLFDEPPDALGQADIPLSQGQPAEQVSSPVADHLNPPETSSADDMGLPKRKHASDVESAPPSSPIENVDALLQQSLLQQLLQQSITVMNESMGDLHIFNLTQRKRPLPQSGDAPSSASSLLSQTLDSLMIEPRNLHEFPVPQSLRKSRVAPALEASGILDHDYFDPSYFRKEDVHAKPLIFANRKIIVPFKGVSSIPDIEISTVPSIKHGVDKNVNSVLSSASKPTLWQYSVKTPSKASIQHWVEEVEKKQIYKRARFRSQIEPAITETNNYKYSYRPKKVTRNPSGFLNMTFFHMELHVNTVGDLHPDPKKDPITLIIFHFNDSNQMFDGENAKTVILTHASGLDTWHFSSLYKRISSHLNVDIKCLTSEKQMVDELIAAIDYFDPDILSGYEVNASSWGFLIERFQTVHDVNLLPRLGRVYSKGNGKFGDRWGHTHTSAIKINGRHMLNIWRLLRHEVSLTSYSLENICYHLLHQTLPKILNQVLLQWSCGGIAGQVQMLCKYYTHRLEVILRIIDLQEFVLRNVELSRLIGVDFYSNFYRGSQFKVESILIRIAKPENMLLNSPSKAQVHAMKPLEVVPLIMEPDSGFYKSPLVVLDFQSLYPSIMIAYNYCYSTLLGKTDGFKQFRNTVGYMNHLQLPRGIIEILSKNDGITISPNGLMFVKSKFRKSILSRMLQEILNMRINVKSVASAFPDDIELGKLFNSKQLALKLIANVTYGYTSASFSGRMPSSDIADAIVATGREILLKAIEIIESGPYSAKVVYGDTDSLFVYFPGRSKEDAFKFGKSLAKSVTDALPDPIKLKFEKVYHPCVLLAKKRYVGSCYEFEEQKVPKFEAKGIETIRRDGIPAQLKMVGKTLRILFESKNLSDVKNYVVLQFFKILANKVNVGDFCFAKEVRYGTYKNERYLPPGAVLAKERVKKDPRSEPQYRERIPYVVIRDSRKERIKDRSVSPEDYVRSFSTGEPMELDYEYYITRVLIPPLERVFNLMGVDIKEWYREMPKSTKLLVMKDTDILRTDFVNSKECYKCGSNLDDTSKYLCAACIENDVSVVTEISLAAKERERIANDYQQLCLVCTVKNFGSSSRPYVGDQCVNGDCQVYYAKVKALREFELVAERKQKIISEISALQW